MYYPVFLRGVDPKNKFAAFTLISQDRSLICAIPLPVSTFVTEETSQINSVEATSAAGASQQLGGPENQPWYRILSQQLSSAMVVAVRLHQYSGPLPLFLYPNAR